MIELMAVIYLKNTSLKTFKIKANSGQDDKVELIAGVMEVIYFYF